jgi:hypothetical protein
VRGIHVNSILLWPQHIVSNFSKLQSTSWYGAMNRPWLEVVDGHQEARHRAHLRNYVT